MPEDKVQQLSALSSHLKSRREAILQAWRRAAEADPEQTTLAALTRAQFYDHIPGLLDSFAEKLVAAPSGKRATAAEATQKQEDIKHGLQRWQQGYRLTELMHEWGHLHLCLFDEINTFLGAHPEIERETTLLVSRELIHLINEGINESANQYARLQQAEAAGHVRDLDRALKKAAEIEDRRANMIRQAVHDLRGNLQSVSTAADVLNMADIDEKNRGEFLKSLHQGVGTLSAMIGELMDLARLEAGQETREVAPFDAATTIAELCTLTRPIAAERKLYLEAKGPSPLNVEGDAKKVRRLLQNLLLNALKYTDAGGVKVTWGEEKDHWWVLVKDTGPGLMAGPGAPIVAGFKEATASAREVEPAAPAGTTPHVLPPPPLHSTGAKSPKQQQGEGIGLSIVKRLCELLDASIELDSSPTSGTTFRVVFPRQYRDENELRDPSGKILPVTFPTGV